MAGYNIGADRRDRAKELFILLLKLEALVGFVALLIVEIFPKQLISLFRELMFGVGFAIILPRFFGLDGVLYSMPVSDFLTFLITICIVRATLRELSGGAAAAAALQ